MVLCPQNEELWVGGDGEVKALYAVACGTKSDHVGAAEGKTSEQR